MQRVKIVIKLFVLLLAVYLLLRVVFQMMYFSADSFSFAQESGVLYWGLRMDFAAIFYSNLIFLIFFFVIAPFLPVPWQHRFAVLLFSVINLPFIALNFIDLFYYRFNLRRSTIDIFYILGDSVHSFGSLLKQYWLALLLFIVVATGFVYVVKKIVSSQKRNVTEKRYLQWLMPLVFIGVSFLIARGWESRPIVPSTALLHVDAAKQPLVNNSTLNLLYSWLRFTAKLQRKDYFTDAGLDSVYTIRRQYPQQEGIDKRNIVVIVLESFNASFFSPGPDRARTPFFDSLMNKSTIYENAFANGHESVKGIMAILGSIPPFLDEPLFISNYSGVPLKGIGSILKEEGYDTNFFLGAEYDHFNFAKLCRMIGIDNYYSKETYGHPEHNDGNWGIYDEYFFSYFANVLSKKQNPFFSVLFNISSHPPFAIPASKKAQFTIQGQLPQQNSISYVDDCFRQLFDKIKTQPWFSNSLFVFCADHTLLENVYDKSYEYKAYHIPLFVFDPKQPTGTTISNTVQQLDIVPSILDKIHYSKPFVSFGNSFFRERGEEEQFSICRKNESYQLIDSTTMTGFDERSGKIIYHYNYRTDTLLTHNLYTPGYPAIEHRGELIKGILQRFNNSLIEEKLWVK
ncbi:MAG: LTA synthase family protein [Chitinophagaceae bacterium]